MGIKQTLVAALLFVITTTLGGCASEQQEREKELNLMGTPVLYVLGPGTPPYRYSPPVLSRGEEPTRPIHWNPVKTQGDRANGIHAIIFEITGADELDAVTVRLIGSVDGDGVPVLDNPITLTCESGPVSESGAARVEPQCYRVVPDKSDKQEYVFSWPTKLGERVVVSADKVTDSLMEYTSWAVQVVE